MHRRIASLITASAVVALTLTACGSPTSTEPTSSPASPSQTATGPTTVRLLAHDSFSVSDELIAELAAEGIALEIVSGGSGGEMTAAAVLTAGSPTADVMYGIDNTFVSRATSAGVFAPFTSSQLQYVQQPFRDDTQGGLITPIDYGDVCVNVDATWFADNGIEAPTTIEQLADPTYAGLLAVMDPATSSPGLAFLLATIARFGEDWPLFWRALAENDVAIESSWTDAYVGQYTAGGGDGTRPLVVSYATSPPAEIVYAGDPKPDKPRTTVMTDGCYRQVEYAGVLAGTTNATAAGKVVDWLLSPGVQADIPLSMFVFPVREGVELPPVFADFAAVVDDPLSLPADEVAENLDGWLAQWGEVMGR